jgi:hypothetical protein
MAQTNTPNLKPHQLANANIKKANAKKVYNSTYTAELKNVVFQKSAK